MITIFVRIILIKEEKKNNIRYDERAPKSHTLYAHTDNDDDDDDDRREDILTETDTTNEKFHSL